MYCCNNTNNELFFSSIDEVSNTIWQDLNCTNNLYFNPNYLIALEKNNPNIHFSYVVLIDENKKPIAFASIQIIDFHLDSVQNELQSVIEKLRCFGRKIGFVPSKKPLKILSCGNTFVSGEHGIFIKENQNKQKVIKQLANALLYFVNSNAKLKKEINAFMIKDFIKESLFISDELHDYNYFSFNVEPNMVLNLNEKWNTFDDYLEAMKTKFRVKAKKALKLSSSLETKEVSLDNINIFLPKMTSLYKTVSSKAEFNLGDFNLETYKNLKENLGENYIIKTYWLQNQLVGFLSGIVNKNCLDAHFVGIDYKHNKTFAVYQRMLYDYIDIAIKKKLTVLNFGRTASEIKSSVGAIPQDLTIYVRHKKSIPNKFLSLFLKRIEPTPFKQKFPFKIEKTTLDV